MKKRPVDSVRSKPVRKKPAKLTRAQIAAHQKPILDLIGKIDWDPTYDYKAERGRR